MAWPADIWYKIAMNVKESLIAKFDQTTIVPPLNDKNLFQRQHKGFYVGIISSSDKEVVRVGFMREDCSDVSESANKVIEALYTELKAKNIPIQVLQTATYHFTIIDDDIHINAGLLWDENKEGVYFSWGDRYQGLYLPYQIKKMDVTKSEIMNRLCSWEANVPSNLWRLPEGMVWKLRCDSYTI